MIEFRKYQNSDYERVCDFLIEINKYNNYHNNWNWARFEWMSEHPETQKEQLGSMGLWFDGENIVGAALIDMYFGEAFVGVLPAYDYLYKEVLEYAFNDLKDDQGLGISFHDDNKKEIEEAIRQGFYKEEAGETDLVISLDKYYPISLPDGFSLEEFDAEKYPKEIEWLFWQGFNHGNDRDEFLKEYQEPTGKRPHFKKGLCIVARNKNGNLVASASCWYDKRTNYAYIEPVCVIPEYRKMGLGKACIYASINNAKELGAEIAIVNSDQEFYKRIGFVKRNHYSFYWKKEERVACGKTYKLERLLGKGKGGYSYLSSKDGKKVVLKQIHHEPCDYYQFGNKIEAEERDYNRLLETGIRIPKMISIDKEQEIIIKEFIDGKTIQELIEDGVDVSAYIPEVTLMAQKAYKAGLNIDYYPTNFVVSGDQLYYIDYECNEYMDEYSFENWGIKYWTKK